MLQHFQGASFRQNTLALWKVSFVEPFFLGISIACDWVEISTNNSDPPTLSCKPSQASGVTSRQTILPAEKLTRQPAHFAVVVWKDNRAPSGSESRRCKVIAGTQAWHGECPIRPSPSVTICRTLYTCVCYICLAPRFCSITVGLWHAYCAGSNFGTAHQHWDCPIEPTSVTILTLQLCGVHVDGTRSKLWDIIRQFAVQVLEFCGSYSWVTYTYTNHSSGRLGPILWVQLWDTTLARSHPSLKLRCPNFATHSK